MIKETTPTEAEAAVMAAILAICDEFAESGLLQRESLAAGFAAQAWVLQKHKLPTAAGMIETLRQALTDEEKRSFRKKLKEQIAGQPPGTEH